MKNIGWMVLNLQLIVGFVYSYDYFHRHFIVDHVLLFTICVVVVSNLLFSIFKSIQYYSLKAFVIIFLSSFLISIFFISFNRDFYNFSVSDLLVISLYLFLRLLLYVTTPIVIGIEVWFKIKAKNHIC